MSRYDGCMALTDEAIAQIKAMIVQGDLKPGDRLPPEKELAERLGLSRNTMREAVKALEVIKVLDVRRGDGTYVTSLEPRLLLEAISFFIDMQDDKSLLEIFAVRRVLEAHASSVAATRATDEEAAALLAEVDGMDGVASIEALVQHDLRFHGMISGMSDNAYLEGLIESLSSQTVRARLWRGLTQGGVVDRTLSEHRAIATAIATHDAALASSLVSMHISGIEQWLRTAVTHENMGAERDQPAAD